MHEAFAYAWYEAAYCLSMVCATLGFSLRLEGRRHVPRQGPVLLIANHQCWFDPALVGLASPRHLCFLARKTLFRHPAFAWLIRSLNAVPLDQEGVAKEGLKTVLAQLKAGQAVLVFPEGERTPDGNMHPFKPGIQLLVRRAQAPVVPVGIAGGFDALPRWRCVPTLSPLFLPAGKATIAVAVGRPMDARRLADLPREQLLNTLFTELEAMHRRAEQIRRKPR